MVDSWSPGKGTGVVGNVVRPTGGASAAVGPLPDWCKDAKDMRATLHWDSE